MSAGALGLGFSVVTQHIGAAVACGGVVLTGAIAEMLRLQRSKESATPVAETTPFEENELSEDTGISPAAPSAQLLGGEQPAAAADLRKESVASTNSPAEATRAAHATSAASAAQAASAGPGLIIDDPSTGPLRGVDAQHRGMVPSLVADDSDEEITGPGPAVAQQRLGTLVQPADYEITDRTPIVASPYDFGDSEDTIGTPIVEPVAQLDDQRPREPWERDRAGLDSSSEPDFLVQGRRTEHVVDAWRGSRQGPHTGSTSQVTPAGDHFTPQTDQNVAAAHQAVGSDVAAAERAAAARAEAGGLGPLPGLDRLRSSSALGRPADDAAGRGFRYNSAPATAEQLKAMPAPAPESGPIKLPGNMAAPAAVTPPPRPTPSSTPRRFLPGGLSDLSVFERSGTSHEQIGEFTDAGQVPESEESALVDLDAEIPPVATSDPQAGLGATNAGATSEDSLPDAVADEPMRPDGATDGEVTSTDRSAVEQPAADGGALGLDAPVTAANVPVGTTWQAMRQRMDEAGRDPQTTDAGTQPSVDYFASAQPEHIEPASVEPTNIEPVSAHPTSAQPDRIESADGEPAATVEASANADLPVNDEGLATPDQTVKADGRRFAVDSALDADPIPATHHSSGVISAGIDATGMESTGIDSNDADELPDSAIPAAGHDSREMAGGSLQTPAVNRTSPFRPVDSSQPAASDAGSDTTATPALSTSRRSPFTGSLPVVPARTVDEPTSDDQLSRDGKLSGGTKPGAVEEPASSEALNAKEELGAHDKPGVGQDTYASQEIHASQEPYAGQESSADQKLGADEKPILSSRRPGSEPQIPHDVPPGQMAQVEEQDVPGGESEPLTGMSAELTVPRSATQPVEPPNGKSIFAASRDRANASDDVLPRPKPSVTGENQSPASAVFRHPQRTDDTQLPSPDQGTGSRGFDTPRPFDSESVPFVDEQAAQRPLRQSPFSGALDAGAVANSDYPGRVSTGVFSTPAGQNDEPGRDIDLTGDDVMDLRHEQQPNQAASTEPEVDREPNLPSRRELRAGGSQAVTPVGNADDLVDHENMFMTGPRALASQRRAARRAKTRRAGRGRGDSVFATQDDSESFSAAAAQDDSDTLPRSPRGPAPRTDQVDESYSHLRRKLEALRDGSTDPEN